MQFDAANAPGETHHERLSGNGRQRELPVITYWNSGRHAGGFMSKPVRKLPFRFSLALLKLVLTGEIRTRGGSSTAFPRATDALPDDAQAPDALRRAVRTMLSENGAVIDHAFSWRDTRSLMPLPSAPSERSPRLALISRTISKPQGGADTARRVHRGCEPAYMAVARWVYLGTLAHGAQAHLSATATKKDTHSISRGPLQRSTRRAPPACASR